MNPNNGIKAIEIVRIADRRIMQVTEDGCLSVCRKKENDTDPDPVASYSRGDIFVADNQGKVISSIFSMDGVASLARCALEGDQRALTDPQTVINLSAAVVALLGPLAGGE